METNSCWGFCSIPSFLSSPPSEQNCRACPKCDLCPLPLLLCWLAGITLLLCSISEQKQHPPPCCLSETILRAKEKTEFRLRYQRVNIFLGLQMYL